MASDAFYRERRTPEIDAGHEAFVQSMREQFYALQSGVVPQASVEPAEDGFMRVKGEQLQFKPELAGKHVGVMFRVVPG